MEGRNNGILLVDFQGLSFVKSVSKYLRTLPCERHMCFARLVTFIWQTIIYYFSNIKKKHKKNETIKKKKMKIKNVQDLNDVDNWGKRKLLFSQCI